MLSVMLAGASLLASGAMDYFLRTFIPDTDRTQQLASINTVTQIALIAGTGIAGAIASFATIGIALFVLSALAGLSTLACPKLLPDLRLAPAAESEPERSGLTLFRASIYLQFPILFYIACCGALVFSVGQTTNMLLPGLIAVHLKLRSIHRSIHYSAIETALSIGEPPCPSVQWESACISPPSR